jgi:protein-S-isoprenylcysteine O-methyltransferase Ste14
MGTLDRAPLRRSLKNSHQNDAVRTARAAFGSLVFLVLAPGIVAGLVPWGLTGWRVRQPLPYWLPLRVAGLILLAAGVAVLLHAFWRFVVEGLGTPAPVVPTKRLVVGGLYRYVRNPMYLAVTATIVGQALALGQPILLLYAAAFAVAVVAFVRWYEEPGLRRRFGDEYETYRRAVPAWWPRRDPWDAAGDDHS